MRVVALSTKDNPFNPITQFDDWYRFDMDKGYSSCSYLARITNSSESNNEASNVDDVESAIDEIIKYDPFDRYIKVVEEVQEDSNSESTNEQT